MDYCMSKTLPGDAATWEPRVREALAGQGFGVLTEIDVEQTLKKKLNADIGPYKILGACNPAFAKGALDLEPRIGVMLPCNVVLRQAGPGKTEISFIDPVASMAAVDNPRLLEHAVRVRDLLRTAFDRLG
jgi:uncharacterized protein (DUF302 family)